MVLPSQGSYSVNAQVVDRDDKNSEEYRYTLDAYSVVKSTSKISPYFVSSVINDPDVRGLTVFVQDYSGERVSRRVHYILNTDPLKPSDGPELPAETTPDLKPETPVVAEPGAEESLAGAGDDVSRKDAPEDETPAPGGAETGGGGSAVPVSSASENAVVAGEPDSGGSDGPAAKLPEDPPAGSSGKTGAGATEAGGIPAETAAGAETGTVGKADAGTADKAETRTGDAADTEQHATGVAGADTGLAEKSPAASGSSPADTARPGSSTAIPEDQTVPVRQLDGYLPAFQITELIGIGKYNLVFQVMGEREILYRTVKPVYFLGDADFKPGDIQSFLPMAISGGRLIPPGINMMLETEISADERLDPYIIWHSGKTILGKGRLSAGANYLLWKTPDRNGFHSVRAEIFPLLPGDPVSGNMTGKIKELSLPVSASSVGEKRFTEAEGEFVNWYQFWGTLDDAKPANRPLVSLQSRPPRWIPFGGIYGLLVGPDDSYELPGTPFKLSPDEQGTGRMFFHLAALSDGSVLHIRFAGGEIRQPASAGQADAWETGPGGTAALDLSLEKNALTLRISSEDAFQEKSIALDSNELNVFITVIVEFDIARTHLDAMLRLESPAREEAGPLLSIGLARPISGEAAVRLGGTAGDTGNHDSGTMALNELALSYVRSPVSAEEELEVPDDLLAAGKDPGAEALFPGAL
jgi:hypothetical protein